MITTPQDTVQPRAVTDDSSTTNAARPRPILGAFEIVSFAYAGFIIGVGTLVVVRDIVSALSLPDYMVVVLIVSTIASIIGTLSAFLRAFGVSSSRRWTDPPRAKSDNPPLSASPPRGVILSLESITII